MSDIFDLFKKIEADNGAQNAANTRKNVTWLIAGLGNHGPEYLGTRHNAGFLALDALAAYTKTRVDRAKYHALIGEAELAGERVILMKPQTYMNASGTAIAEAAAFYKLDRAHILVFSDDINLEPGRLRFRQKGSAGGQNGLKSIIECLGGDDFPRIRLGVGAKPTPEYDLADWVLGKMPLPDRAALDARLPDVCRGAEAVLRGDFDLASRICNSAPQKPQENGNP